MATEDSSATFKDILLELMVANETLDRIEVSIAESLAVVPEALPVARETLPAIPDTLPVARETSSRDVSETLPALVETLIDAIETLPTLVVPSGTTARAQSLNAPKAEVSEQLTEKSTSAKGQSIIGDPVLEYCEKILECCNKSYHSLTLIAEETVYSGGVLIQIRNALFGMRDLAELERLRNLEKDREARSTTRTGVAGARGENQRVPAGAPKDPKDPEGPGLIGNIGKVAAIIGTTVASLAFIPAAIKAFLKQVRAEINASLSPKTLEKIKTSFARKAPAPTAGPLAGEVKTAAPKRVGEVKIAGTMAEGIAETRKGISEGFGIIRKNLLDFGEGLTGIGRTMREGATEIMAGIREGFGILRKALMESQLGRFFSEIGESFRSVGKAFGDIAGTFKSAGQGEGFFARTIRSITSIFDFIGEMGSKFKALGTAVGELLGKIALPLTIILGIKDAITGWMSAKGDWTNKLQGAITELIDGLIGFAVDLPKMLISWVAGKLGFKEFEKELDKMNFKDSILKPFIEWAQNLFKNFFTWMGIGTTTTKAIERNVVKEDMKRNPKVLDNAASALVNPDITPGKKAQLNEMLKVEYGFTKEEIDSAIQAKVSSRIVNPQSDMSTAKKTGAEMTAYQKETSDLTAGTTATVVVAPGGGGANVNTANVNNVTVNNSNLPDRTQSYMVPAFGF